MEWMSGVDNSKKPTVNYLVELNQRLQKDIRYLVRMETGVQTCEETLEKRSGSCRDSAWLLVQILRHLGLAARFVSGYLVQLTADVKALDGPAGPDHDFTDLHAWAEVYLPGAGWVGIDPTSGLFAAEGHIPLACTPDPASAAPVTGETSMCEVSFNFSNEVERIHEDPRVTKPYSDTQWQTVLSLGEKVEKELVAGDVRLTMGGEPTFVSIDDMEGDEWNNAALGKDKRKFAGELLLRLRDKFSKGGFLHYGQGKWYPGEPLPRWALSLFWRKDGHPVWNDHKWLADENHDYGHGIDETEKFIRTLTDSLGIDKSRIVSGFENTVHYLLKEESLPENLDPLDNKLSDPLERKRLTKIFRQGLQTVIGYALPIKWKEQSKDNGIWVSSPWPFKSKYMYLLPGDSAMGLRLPLESLPWEMPDSDDIDLEKDPFDDRDELPKSPKRYKKHKKSSLNKKIEIVHTALCVESRKGQIYVFMPPLSSIEPYLELLSMIEATAKKLKLPVIIEGYEPAWDPRLTKLQITPDPGVIEVNIHPAHNW